MLLSQNWVSDFHWLQLHRDPVYNLVRVRAYPGSVLVRLGLGLSGATVPSLEWEIEVAAALRERQPYKLRLHLYQVWLSCVEDVSLCVSSLSLSKSSCR